MARLPSPTLAGLIALGFLVVAVPLVVAIVTAIVKVDELAGSSRQALVSVQQNTSLSRALATRVRELERTARQFQALGDAAYRELYLDHRAEVRTLLGRLGDLNENSELTEPIQRAVEAERRANEAFEAVGAGGTVESLQLAFAGLAEDVLVIVQGLNAEARSLSNAMPERAGDLQGLLIGQATLVIPLSVVLALLFGVLISRSVAQIDHGIRTLGGGALREPIEVRGTRDMEELGRRLEWLRVRLAELEAQKAEFLRNVSHELKTPLTNIREATELLREDAAMSEEGEEITRILKSNSVRLQQLIEELLRYGADSALREAEPAQQRLAFDALVGDAVAKTEAAEAARTVTLRSELAPAFVHGNAKHLRVVVDNLLSNAIRYSPCGGEVDVRLSVKDGSVVLDVADQGPGVSEQDAEHLFDWFYTGQQPATALIPGTGIGLAIAQEYAQQHAGLIELIPSDAGAHFRLTLGGRADA